MACGLTLKRPFFECSGSPSTFGDAFEPVAKRPCSWGALSPHTAPSPPRQPLQLPALALSPRQVTDSRQEELLKNVGVLYRRLKRKARYNSRPSLQPTSLSHRLHRTPHRPAEPTDARQSSEDNSQPARTSRACSPDLAMFTAKQARDFCERKLQEREEQLREVFDQVLAERLTEQYDSFVRFTEDYLRRRFANTECQYVS